MGQRLHVNQPSSRTLTRERQLRAWHAGVSRCPNMHGECCPDFSCCRPQLAWSRAQRGAFIAAGPAEREQMLLGVLGNAMTSLGFTANFKAAAQVEETRRAALVPGQQHSAWKRLKKLLSFFKKTK